MVIRNNLWKQVKENTKQNKFAILVYERIAIDSSQ